MTSRDFCYWLQGFFEINDAQEEGCERKRMDLPAAKLDCIRNHLNMVFKHEIDPSHGDAKHQQELAAAHQGKSTTLTGSGTPRC